MSGPPADRTSKPRRATVAHRLACSASAPTSSSFSSPSFVATAAAAANISRAAARADSAARAPATRAARVAPLWVTEASARRHSAWAPATVSADGSGGGTSLITPPLPPTEPRTASATAVTAAALVSRVLSEKMVRHAEQFTSDDVRPRRAAHRSRHRSRTAAVGGVRARCGEEESSRCGTAGERVSLFYEFTGRAARRDAKHNRSAQLRGVRRRAARIEQRQNRRAGSASGRMQHRSTGRTPSPRRACRFAT